MAILSLILAVCGLCACAYLWLELRRKVSSEDIAPALRQASDELSKNYATQLRGIETEWAEMYQKFMRIAGRVDKVAALETRKEPETQSPVMRRSDILRRRRG